VIVLRLVVMTQPNAFSPGDLAALLAQADAYPGLPDGASARRDSAWLVKHLATALRLALGLRDGQAFVVPSSVERGQVWAQVHEVKTVRSRDGDCASAAVLVGGDGGLTRYVGTFTMLNDAGWVYLGSVGGGAS
jgi:hypothetical protein